MYMYISHFPLPSRCFPPFLLKFMASFCHMYIYMCVYINIYLYTLYKYNLLSPLSVDFMYVISRLTT